jgi:phosphotransferase system enzyme I (PtsI)
MIVFDGNSPDPLSRKNNSETVLKARAVSRGFAIGRVVCLHGQKRQFYRINLKNSEIENELVRFRVAVQLAKSQIKNINAQKSEVTSENKTSIFDAHLLILEDKSLLSKIENTIKDGKINSEWAVKLAVDDYLTAYKTIADGHLRERYIDVEDVLDRLQAALVAGEQKSIVHLGKKSIIVAKDLKPSTLIELTDSNPRAIITETGGWTSHTFILARELNLPAVTGLKGILRRVQTGDEVIVDGYNGKVILHPKKETSQKFKIEAAQFQEINTEKIEKIKPKLATLDGREITIRANVDLPAGYIKAKRYGARGIGLYRSEFLFNRYKGFPSEDEQIKAYKKAAKSVGEDGICIRTFDINVEQLAEEGEGREQNSALGLRGIRLGLSQTKQFNIQLRALLRASAENKIDIVLPMISDVSEILLTKSILEKEKLTLKKQKIKFGNPRVGAMIEVPATIFIIEEIAQEVDFLSLGTNDLVQYLLAVDRDNESVADWFRTLHPAVLHSIKRIIDVAEASKTPLIICGEMAGSPVYAAILIGLGANELSMNPNSILRVRKTISAIAFEEAREITKQLLKCKTSDAVEHLVSELFIKNWSHLFSPDILPVIKK